MYLETNLDSASSNYLCALKACSLRKRCLIGDDIQSAAVCVKMSDLLGTESQYDEFKGPNWLTAGLPKQACGYKVDGHFWKLIPTRLKPAVACKSSPKNPALWPHCWENIVLGALTGLTPGISALRVWQEQSCKSEGGFCLYPMLTPRQEQGLSWGCRQPSKVGRKATCQ